MNDINRLGKSSLDAGQNDRDMMGGEVNHGTDFSNPRKACSGETKSQHGQFEDYQDIQVRMKTKKTSEEATMRKSLGQHENNEELND